MLRVIAYRTYTDQLLLIVTRIVWVSVFAVSQLLISISYDYAI